MRLHHTVKAAIIYASVVMADNCVHSIHYRFYLCFCNQLNNAGNVFEFKIKQVFSFGFENSVVDKEHCLNSSTRALLWTKPAVPETRNLYSSCLCLCEVLMYKCYTSSFALRSPLVDVLYCSIIYQLPTEWHRLQCRKKTHECFPWEVFRCSYAKGTVGEKYVM